MPACGGDDFLKPFFATCGALPVFRRRVLLPLFVTAILSVKEWLEHMVEEPFSREACLAVSLAAGSDYEGDL